MRKESQLIRDRVGRIVCMGGALDVPGNTSPVAECKPTTLSVLYIYIHSCLLVNFYADPYAVKELLFAKHGIPLDRFVMLPLDITTPHELPFPFYIETIDPAFHNTSRPSISQNKSPLAHFTSSFLERTREIMLQFGKDAMELHDIVAVWCATANPPFADDESGKLAPGWHGSRRIFDIERCVYSTRVLVCPPNHFLGKVSSLVGC